MRPLPRFLRAVSYGVLSEHTDEQHRRDKVGVLLATAARLVESRPDLDIDEFSEGFTTSPEMMQVLRGITGSEHPYHLIDLLHRAARNHAMNTEKITDSFRELVRARREG